MDDKQILDAIKILLAAGYDVRLLKVIDNLHREERIYSLPANRID